MRRTSRGKSAFTLIELLVVVAIIALLISILLPSLRAAREGAKQTVCGTNQRSIGTGMALYTAEQNAYPAAYLYDPMTIAGGQQTPDSALNGYLHWSWFIYNQKQSNFGQNLIAAPQSMGTLEKAFQCPSLALGGLPPTNPAADNMDAAQAPETPSVVDRQARRMAYTANEALIPRNKFVLGFQGAQRTYRWVKPEVVRRAGGTILATEFGDNWRIVSGNAYVDTVTGTGQVCKSHRPLHGFRGINGELDMSLLPYGANPAPLVRVVADDIRPNPEPGAASETRLDWAGRNHGPKSKKRTNFLYADSHVENKVLEKTVARRVANQVVGKGEWGEVFYSLQGGNIFAPGQEPN